MGSINSRISCLTWNKHILEMTSLTRKHPWMYRGEGRNTHRQRDKHLGGRGRNRVTRLMSKGFPAVLFKHKSRSMSVIVARSPRMLLHRRNNGEIRWTPYPFSVSFHIMWPWSFLDEHAVVSECHNVVMYGLDCAHVRRESTYQIAQSMSCT